MSTANINSVVGMLSWFLDLCDGRVGIWNPQEVCCFKKEFGIIAFDFAFFLTLRKRKEEVGNKYPAGSNLFTHVV